MCVLPFPLSISCLQHPACRRAFVLGGERAHACVLLAHPSRYGYCCGDGMRKTATFTGRGDITYITGGTISTYMHSGGDQDADEASPSPRSPRPSVPDTPDSRKSTDGPAEMEYPNDLESVGSVHRQCSYLEHGCNCNFSCLDMHPDGLHAAAGEFGPEATVIVFNVYSMDVVRVLSAPLIPDQGVVCISFSIDGDLLAIVGADPQRTLSVFLWNQEEPELVASHYIPTALSRTPMATSIEPGQASPEPEVDEAKHTVDAVYHVHAMKFNTCLSQSSRLWTCGTQETKIWQVDVEDMDLAGAEALLGEDGIVQTCLCVTFDEHGDAITGTKSGDVYFWRANHLRRVELGVHRGPVHCVETKPRLKELGGAILFSAGKDGVVQEWVMKHDVDEYLNEIEWRMSRCFKPDVTSIHSISILADEGILCFGTQDTGLHEFTFGNTGGYTEEREKETQVTEDLEEMAINVLEETYIPLLKPCR